MTLRAGSGARTGSAERLQLCHPETQRNRPPVQSFLHWKMAFYRNFSTTGKVHYVWKGSSFPARSEQNVSFLLAFGSATSSPDPVLCAGP